MQVVLDQVDHLVLRVLRVPLDRLAFLVPQVLLGLRVYLV